MDHERCPDIFQRDPLLTLKGKKKNKKTRENVSYADRTNIQYTHSYLDTYIYIYIYPIEVAIHHIILLHPRVLYYPYSTVYTSNDIDYITHTTHHYYYLVYFWLSDSSRKYVTLCTSIGRLLAYQQQKERRNHTYTISQFTSIMYHCHVIYTT